MNRYCTGAVLSADGNYRYLLERSWDGGGKAVGFVMLNPSTADALDDDPTIRRCVKFADGFGYRELHVVNLFAWRATDPKDLPTDADVAMGRENVRYLKHFSLACQTIVVAWGAYLPNYASHANGILLRLTLAQFPGHDLQCLGTTQQGQPRHPLYLRGDTQLEPFTLP